MASGDRNTSARGTSCQTSPRAPAASGAPGYADGGAATEDPAHHAERLSVLAEVGAAIQEAHSPREVSAALLPRLRRLVGAPFATTSVLDFDAGLLWRIAVDSDRETAPSVGAPVPIAGLGPLDEVRAGRPQVVRDIRTISDRAPLVDALIASGLRSMINLPLVAGGEVMGVLTLVYDQPAGLPKGAKLEAARELAGHLAVAMRQARRDEQLERRLLQADALARLGRRALGGHGLGGLLAESCQLLVDMLGVDCAKVLELRPGGEELLLVAGAGWADGLVGKATMDAGPHSQAGYTLVTDEPVVVVDLAGERRFRPQALLRDRGVASGVTVTIAIADGPYGVLGVHATSPRRYTEHDVSLVQAVANVLAEAIQRERAEDALVRSNARLRLLRDIDLAILAARSPAEIAAAVLPTLRRLVPCRRASVALFDLGALEAELIAGETEGGTEIRPGVRYPLGAIAGGDELVAALGRGEIRTLDVASMRGGPSPFDALAREGVAYHALVPLLAEGELLGSLNISGDTADGLAPGDAEVAREVAAQLAIALWQARLHEQLERSAEELSERVVERTAELAERNAELDAFAYTVSHDLRAPLRAMRGFGQALLEDYGGVLDAEGRDYAERIVGAAGRLDTLISDLLAYSRLTRAELAPGRVALAAVVAQVLRERSAELEAAGAAVEIESTLPDVTAHGGTLAHVLGDLVGNAVKFVRAGVDPRVRLRAESRGGAVRLWVEDNGIGIEPEHLERIFRPFERLHGRESYPGTGIGLAIVSKGVERMGGSVGVESAPGEGSRFWLELPAAAAGGGT